MPRTQKGQALIYGLFFLVAGLSGLFFLFNTGQLIQDKTKLVNTADAVAYSAGVMQARAMNFSAYTNRALVANEVAIAQMVSLSSWSEYLVEHGQSAMTQLGCTPETYFMSSEPGWKLMFRYTPLCMGLGAASSVGALVEAGQIVKNAAKGIAQASEVAKLQLKASQQLLNTRLLFQSQRARLMQAVADANYGQGEGAVKVDLLPLRDTFHAFADSGQGMVSYRKDQDRVPLADFVSDVVKLDAFVHQRNWGDVAGVPSCLPISLDRDSVDRVGTTRLNGLDQWQANDQANFTRRFIRTNRLGISRCAQSIARLGTGAQSASHGEGSGSEEDWSFYSGIPEFNELSTAALASTDPRAEFVVRVLRERSQTPTSEARSEIKTSPRLNNYRADLPSENTYVGLSAAEVFFDRPTKRKDEKKELASLFNPYWQVHLMAVNEPLRQLAWLRQGGQ